MTTPTLEEKTEEASFGENFIYQLRDNGVEVDDHFIKVLDARFTTAKREALREVRNLLETGHPEPSNDTGWSVELRHIEELITHLESELTV